METRTPEFKKWIKDANEDEYRLFMIDKIYENKMVVTEQYKDLKAEHKRQHTVMLGNGIKKEVSLKYAVGEIVNRQELMRDRLDQVFIDTTFIRDANTLGSIIKRHKWLFSAGMLTTLATILKIWMG